MNPTMLLPVVVIYTVFASTPAASASPHQRVDANAVTQHSGDAPLWIATTQQPGQVGDGGRARQKFGYYSYRKLMHRDYYRKHSYFGKLYGKYARGYYAGRYSRRAYGRGH